MDDKTLALLGGHEAAERLTERGELLACPFCGNEYPTIVENQGYGYHVKCPMCEITFVRDFYSTGRGELGKERTLEAWNHRAPILTPNQMAALRLMEEPRAFEEGDHDKHTSDNL